MIKAKKIELGILGIVGHYRTARELVLWRDAVFDHHRIVILHRHTRSRSRLQRDDTLMEVCIFAGLFELIFCNHAHNFRARQDILKHSILKKDDVLTYNRYIRAIGFHRQGR